MTNTSAHVKTATNSNKPRSLVFASTDQQLLPSFRRGPGSCHGLGRMRKSFRSFWCLWVRGGRNEMDHPTHRCPTLTLIPTGLATHSSSPGFPHPRGFEKGAYPALGCTDTQSLGCRRLVETQFLVMDRPIKRSARRKTLVSKIKCMLSTNLLQ